MSYVNIMKNDVLTLFFFFGLYLFFPIMIASISFETERQWPTRQHAFCALI